MHHFPSSLASLTERDVTDTDDNSLDNTDAPEAQGIVGIELALLKHAEELIYRLTLFTNLFPRVVTLNTWVVEVWDEAQEVLGYSKQSERSRTQVRRRQNYNLGERLIIFRLVEAVPFMNSFALCIRYEEDISSDVQVGLNKGSREACRVGTVFARG